MTDAPPDIDFSRITFPSDRLTLGAIRAAQPNQFRDSPTFVDVVGMMQVERWLAHKAYAAALGLPDPHPHDDRRGLISSLADSYRLFGLQAGARLTREWVKTFEAEAAAQAPPRGR